MKKCITTLVALLFTQMIFAQTVNFTDKNNVFTIAYPETWSADDESYEDRAAVELKSPKLDGGESRGEAFMMVAIEKMPPGVKTMAQFIAMNDKQFKKLKEIKLLKKEKVGDKYAYTMQQTAGKKVLKSVSYFWLVNGKLVSATYGAESKNYDKYLTAAKAVVESFKNELKGSKPNLNIIKKAA